MSKSYREIYEKGKFKDLIFAAGKDESDQGKFWMMVAYFNLGKVELAKNIVKKYSDDFSQIENEELRDNFIRYSNHLDSEVHRPIDEMEVPHYSPKWEKVPEKIDQKLINLFPSVLGNLDTRTLSNHYVSSKHVVFGEYYCKFSEVDDTIEGGYSDLKRQYLLLKKLQKQISVKVPNPLEYKLDESTGLEAFIYRKIPGNTMSLIKDKQPLLDLIIELQQLQTVPNVKPLLKEFTPELDDISQSLTIEHMLQAKGSNLDTKRAEIVRSFIHLCLDHLPKDPERTFVHGDLYTGNLVVNESQKITGLIDFERGWYADKWIDWAKLDYNNDTLRSLLELYNDQIDLIDRDYIFARILLYRGMFILRQMRHQRYHHLNFKIKSWIIQPYNKLQELLD